MPINFVPEEGLLKSKRRRTIAEIGFISLPFLTSGTVSYGHIKVELCNISLVKYNKK